MILFFAQGECDSDAFVTYCYERYAELVPGLPASTEIVRVPGEKPRLTAEGVHFSLSHSHGVMMAGFSDAEIGVDIEKVRPVRRERFAFVDAADERDFFAKWTERESYLKYTGAGLKDFRAPIPRGAHFEHFDVFDGYDACVCAPRQDIIAYLLDISEISG